MSKKIKVIDLLNKIAKDESYRPTVKYQEMTYTYQWDIGDYTNDFNSEYGIFSDWALNLMLNNEVEILEDNTEEIEELEYEESKMYCDTQLIESTKTAKQEDIIDKINELVKSVNKIRKEKNNV